jgi:hypothetical protein
MIVFDLDGTLADCSHRQHLVQGKSRTRIPDWNRFFAECVHDKPIQPLVTLFGYLYRAQATDLEIWSGRSEAVHRETVDWLDTHVFAPLDMSGAWLMPGSRAFVRLRMRPEKDTCPDNILKLRFLLAARDAGQRIELVIDDRQKVVDMWRENGVTCLQCAPGDF